MNRSNPILQLKKNPRSRALAVKAMCAQCFGCTANHIEEGFRASIRNCSSNTCALHPLRPFKHGKRALKDPKWDDERDIRPLHWISAKPAKKSLTVKKT